MALKEVYDYFHSYDKQTYQVVACMGNEPSEEDVKDFESQYKIKLPVEFRKFTMSPLGGLYMEVREEIWPRAKQYDIGPSGPSAVESLFMESLMKYRIFWTYVKKRKSCMMTALQTIYHFYP